MRKRLIIILLTAVFLFLGYKQSIALECDQITDSGQKITCLENVTKNLREQANTLSSQTQYLNSQITITTLKIQETEENIKKTQNEIGLLTSKIEGLDTSLNYLSKMLIDRVVDGYKKRSVSFFNVVLDSDNAFDLFNRIKYLKTAQNNNQKVLVQVQSTKTNFEEQKKIREEKEKKLNQLQITLDQQKNNLRIQQTAKENLLAETKNSELVYQSLLEKAKQELAGFSAFAQSAGGGPITFGNGSNGWYYTQRDPRWGSILLPGSSSSVLLAGCAVTSVAMICKNYGQDVTPMTIVSDSSKFIGGDLWNWAFSCSGKSTSWDSNTSKENIKSYVTGNNPVILRLIAPSVSGLHFIVGWGWNENNDDLMIHDPYYGPDILFSSRYSWSQITTVIVIR